ncbi:MAG: hypothetical protein ACRDIZ_12680 [Actinomycetota bacterium]
MPGRGAVLPLVCATAFLAACTEDAPPPEEPLSLERTAASLVRVGTRPAWIRSGDIDGDGVEELVVYSVAQHRAGTVPYLEVFRREKGRWRRVFDATGNAPPGAGAPEQMLIPPEEGFVSQSVRRLRLVDFAGDGRPEIVAGIQNFGAGEGPLEVWILSMEEDGSLTTEFYGSSSRGGDVVRILGNRVRFEFHVYRKDDPGCCPTFTDTVVIGWDEASGRIDVLERTRRPSGLGLG